MQVPNYPSLSLAPTQTKTYEISAPVQTHYRPATCEEAGCLAHRHGWRTAVDVGSTLGAQQAAYIRARSGRRFREEPGDGTIVYFAFEAGQACFASASHRVPLERPALFVVRDGDFRGNPSGRTRTHTRPADWVEDFAGHQQGLADAHNQG